MALMSYRKEKDEGEKIEERGKARSRIHLIKVDHGITKVNEPLTVLPQFLLISFTKTFVQPLNRKTKINKELSATIRDICNLTRRICTGVNPKKLLFAISAPCIHHETLLGDRHDSLNAHSLLPIVLKALLRGLFSLLHLEGRVGMRSTLTLWPRLGSGASESAPSDGGSRSH